MHHGGMLVIFSVPSPVVTCQQTLIRYVGRQGRLVTFPVCTVRQNTL